MTMPNRLLALTAACAALAACEREVAEPASPPPVAPVAVPSTVPAIAFTCQSGETVSVQYPDAATANVAYQGRTSTLRLVEAASGARYSGSGLQWWTATRDGIETGTLGRVSATDGGVAAVLERCTRAVPTPAPVAAGPRPGPCTASQLSLSRVGGDAGMGNRVATLALRNTGAQPCELTGYPSVALTDAEDTPVTTVRNEQTPQNHFRNGPEPTPVVLPTQGLAEFDIAWNVVPNEAMGQTECPEATGLRVTPPGVTGTVSLAMDVSPCSGYLRVSPLRPGTAAVPPGATPAPGPAAL